MTKHFLILVCAGLSAVSLKAQTIEGVALAIDGDTLDMTGTRVRLVGIDAPEAKQDCTRDGVAWACGQEATASLTSMISSSLVVCVVVDVDVYDRMVARCRTSAFDLGQEQLRRGMAILLDGAPDEYQAAADIAQSLNSGIWSSTFERPDAWRAANKSQESAAVRQAVRKPQRTAPATEPVYRNQFGCAIKGNRSRRGEWIYHLPGQPYYEETRPEELFCTESEARAAGYRRSKAG